MYKKRYFEANIGLEVKCMRQTTAQAFIICIAALTTMDLMKVET
jgi:hypothetical protein